MIKVSHVKTEQRSNMLVLVNTDTNSKEAKAKVLEGRLRLLERSTLRLEGQVTQVKGDSGCCWVFIL